MGLGAGSDDNTVKAFSVLGTFGVEQAGPMEVFALFQGVEGSTDSRVDLWPHTLTVTYVPNVLAVTP